MTDTSSTTIPSTPVPSTDWQFQDRLATAFDEVSILEEMGGAGWELTSFGPFLLHFRRPEVPAKRQVWQHLRITEVLDSSRRTLLERDGWTYCGAWLGTLHYFKRPVTG